MSLLRGDAETKDSELREKSESGIGWGWGLRRTRDRWRLGTRCTHPALHVRSGDWPQHVSTAHLAWHSLLS